MVLKDSTHASDLAGFTQSKLVDPCLLFFKEDIDDDYVCYCDDQIVCCCKDQQRKAQRQLMRELSGAEFFTLTDKGSLTDDYLGIHFETLPALMEHTFEATQTGMIDKIINTSKLLPGLQHFE